MHILFSLMTAISFIVLTSSEALAATNCVQLENIVEYGQGKKSITNTCNRKIHVIWCHTKSGSEFSSGFCGRDGNHYQKEYVLEPGETYKNMYSLPENARVSYGACFGSYGSAQPSGLGTNFNCQ